MFCALPHDGVRPFNRKVNSPHAVNFSASCGANSATEPSNIRGNETQELDRAVGDGCLGVGEICSETVLESARRASGGVGLASASGVLGLRTQSEVAAKLTSLVAIIVVHRSCSVAAEPLHR